VARHRKNLGAEENPAEDPSVPATRRQTRTYVLAAAMVLVVLLAWVAWVMTEPKIPGPSDTTTPASLKENQAIEGFGEASPSPSPPPRPSPRVSPSRGVASGSPAAVAPVAAHYRFDETSGTTTSDASGNGRTANLHGGASFTQGRLGNGVALSGSSQYVALPSGILSGATGFTVSAWVRLDAVTTWSRVFDFGSGTGVNMFLTPRSSAGTARFAITTSGAGGEQRINAPAALPSAQWTHVAVTMSGGTGVLYVNRAEVARTTGMSLTPASLGNTPDYWIGRSHYTADPYLDGIVDDLRLYTRALSPAEIAALP